MNRPADGRRPVRVLHLRDSPWMDGPGRTILESGSRFDSQRIDFRVAVFVGQGVTDHPMILEAGKRHVAISPIEDRGGIDTDIIDAIVRLVDQFDIEILHASDFRSSVYSLLARRQRRHLCLVRTAHGWIANTTRRRILRMLDKMLLRSFDHVTLVSSAMRSLVTRWWLPDARVSIVHNALDAESYGRANATQARTAPDPSRRVVLLNVGRLSPEKGQDLLLEAVACLTADFPGLNLRFAGIGSLEASLKSLATDLGLADRVAFLGYVEDMPELYKNADIVVQSSLTEGLPNVVLEAALLGIPVLATDVGGTREVIEHGKSGWLIRPGSVDEIAAGIRHYLRNPLEHLNMTHAARARVIDEFSMDARVDKMTKIYERIART